MTKGEQIVVVNWPYPISTKVAADIDEALLEAKREQALADCRAVRDRCTICTGSGCDGDPLGGVMECEYCGRPIQAIKFACLAATGKTLEDKT